MSLVDWIVASVAIAVAALFLFVFERSRWKQWSISTIPQQSEPNTLRHDEFSGGACPTKKMSQHPEEMLAQE